MRRLLSSLTRRIKWAVAGRDLAELERWRVAAAESDRWLAEFPDAVSAITHLRRRATGADTPFHLTQLRDGMRTRRDARVWSGSFNRARRAEYREVATDWDVAERYLDQIIAADGFDRAHAAIMSPPEAHRVAYKFLSPGCESRS